MTAKCLNISANKQMVIKNFNPLPRFIESNTCSALLAPIYLNAYKANTKLGSTITRPPANAEAPACTPQPTKTITAAIVATIP